MTRLSSISYAAGLALLLSLSQICLAQWDYDYVIEEEPNVNGLQCGPNGADRDTWQCHLCNQYDTWPQDMHCLANYTHFDYDTPGQGTAYVGWLDISGFQIVSTKTQPAIKPFTQPNHIQYMSPGAFRFQGSYNNIAIGYGRLHAFYYACSDGAGTAVPCNITFTANLINNSLAGNSNSYLRTGTPFVSKSTVLSYKPSSPTNAPMKLGNLTRLSEVNYHATKNWVVEKFAWNYTFSAVKADGCHAMLHVDSMQHGWWYPW